MLNSSLSSRRVVSPQQNVTFTCTTRGSLILEWYSDHYIGTGGERLQLLSLTCFGTDVRSNINPNAVATCTDVYEENGETVIVSELRITVSEQFPTSTITCTYNGEGSRASTTFQLVEGNNYNLQYYYYYRVWYNNNY